MWTGRLLKPGKQPLLVSPVGLGVRVQTWLSVTPLMSLWLLWVCFMGHVAQCDPHIYCFHMLFLANETLAVCNCLLLLTDASVTPLSWFTWRGYPPFTIRRFFVLTQQPPLLNPWQLSLQKKRNNKKLKNWSIDFLKPPFDVNDLVAPPCPSHWCELYVWACPE